MRRKEPEGPERLEGPEGGLMWHGHLAHEARVTGILPVPPGWKPGTQRTMGKMPIPRRLFWLTATLVALIAVCSAATAGEPASRIVSVGGSVTETIYALGAQDRIVAVDTSSTYPEAAKSLPQIGYARTLAAEGGFWPVSP